jgi:hypothetical protein
MLNRIVIKVCNILIKYPMDSFLEIKKNNNQKEIEINKNNN